MTGGRPDLHAMVVHEYSGPCSREKEALDSGKRQALADLREKVQTLHDEAVLRRGRAAPDSQMWLMQHGYIAAARQVIALIDEDGPKSPTWLARRREVER